MAADCRCGDCGRRFMASGQDDPCARAGGAKAAGRGGGHPLPGPLRGCSGRGVEGDRQGCVCWFATHEQRRAALVTMVSNAGHCCR